MSARAMKLMIQPDAGLAPVVQAIRRAKRTVDIAIFRLNRPELESALGAAVQRGVKVRALVAHTNRGGATRLRKLEQRLLGAGVMVSRTGEDFVKYHGKYLIVDGVQLYLLGFNYNHNQHNTCQGRCKVEVESIAEWSPEDPAGPAPEAQPVGAGMSKPPEKSGGAQSCGQP